MRVRALKEGFNVGRRRKGAVFEYQFPRHQKGSKKDLPDWVEVVSSTTPLRKAEHYPPEDQPQVALSELAKKGKQPKDEPETLSEASVPEPDGGTEPAFLK